MNSPEAKPLILSIDDNQDVLRLIERLLEKSGYEVCTRLQENVETATC